MFNREDLVCIITHIQSVTAWKIALRLFDSSFHCSMAFYLRLLIELDELRNNKYERGKIGSI